MSEIHEAIENRDIVQAKEIIRLDPDVVNLKDGNGNAPIHIAAYTGQIELIDLLIESGANINDLGDMDRTPLHYSAIEGELSVTIFLLEHNAEIAPVDLHGNTPLYYSMQGRFEQTNVAEILLSHHAPIDVNSAVWIMNSKEFDRWVSVTPDILKTGHPERLLTDAIIKGDFDLVETLLKHKIPINGTESARPLTLAISRPDIMQKLLESGADITVRDSFGDSAIDKAKEIGAINIVSMLQKFR